jgi:hypothetical protein
LTKPHRRNHGGAFLFGIGFKVIHRLGAYSRFFSVDNCHILLLIKPLLEP